MLLRQGAWVQSLVGELRSHMPYDVAKRKSIEVLMANSGKGEECSVTCAGPETGTVGEEAEKTDQGSFLEGFKATDRN